jgi:DNA-binding response OmpR family regulator
MNKSQVDLTGSRILAVDDVPANLDVLFQTLDENGYSVLVATNGTTAIEVAANARPDLILLDVMMPGIDGYETCRRIKRDPDLEEIPVLFLTARDDIEGIVEGFQSGGMDYITKPFKKEEILARIKTHLERAHFARELAEINALLEEKVKERTLQLQLKVSELEGKDRIAQHLLVFHSLEETLELVLEVVVDILELDRAVVHLVTGDGPRPAAAVGFSGAGVMVPHGQLDRLPLSAEHQRAFVQVLESGQPLSIDEPKEPSISPFAVVPILRGETLLGLITVDNYRSARPIVNAELRTLDSFSLQAAVAINDAQVRRDPRAWAEQLDEVLEIDDEAESIELDGIEIFEDPAGRGGS